MEDRFKDILQAGVKSGGKNWLRERQGITKTRIRKVLKKVDRHTPDIVDAVFALLDDEMPSIFSKAEGGATFADGASTAHIGCHIGILQRRKGKLDREGRDYWIKPMVEIGALEKVFLVSETGRFIPGHPIPKSSHCAYRLSEGFRRVLVAPSASLMCLLEKWSSDDATRERLRIQAGEQDQSRQQVGSRHEALINKCASLYANRFLQEFIEVYRDVGDGDRVDSEAENTLAQAGVVMGLEDAMPDLLLWNQASDRLWAIEAVTSDGEVDLSKVKKLEELAERNGKAGIDFTTAYWTWQEASSRQAKHKNLAPGTYLWMVEDPSKHFLAETFPDEGQSSQEVGESL